MKTEGFPGRSILRALLLAAVLTLLAAGAVAPGAARADDDDNGDNGDVSEANVCVGGDATTTEMVVPGVGTVVVQTCTITESSGRCIQRSSEPLIIQQCFVNQGPTIAAGMPVSNSLVVDQLVDQHGIEGLLDATQIVDGPPPLTRGEQRTFGSTGNSANIKQQIVQKLASGIDDDDDGVDDDDNGEVDEDDDGEDDDDNGEENGPPDIRDLIEQFEQTHQWVDLCQGGVPACEDFAALTGRNRSTVYQSAESFELAANALTINQFQNDEARTNTCSDGPDSGQDDNFARMCYVINQYTSNTSQSLSNPANYSKLSQYNNQVQHARNAGGGQQSKGFNDELGGLDHSFIQFTPPGLTSGIALLVSDQDEYQVQREVNSPLMIQGQFGNIRKGSGEQDSNPNSVTRLVLDKDQYQGEAPPFEGQTGSARAFAQTSGECIADLSVTQNGETETAQEPGGDKTPAGDVCAEFVLCGDAFGEEFPSPPEGDDCVSSDDPCPPGTERDPETGLCETVCPPGEVFNPDTNECEPILTIALARP